LFYTNIELVVINTVTSTDTIYNQEMLSSAAVSSVWNGIELNYAISNSLLIIKIYLSCENVP
jgi:hypothetical protein